MEKLDAICAVIREEGVSDGAAAARVGVPHTTLSRWKAQDEGVAVELAVAREFYLSPRLEKIAQARRKDGTFDWHAQKWLMKFAAPALYGRPSRRRRLRDVMISEEETRAAMIPSSETPAVSQADRVTFSPEIPGSGATGQLVQVKSVTLSPETPVEPSHADLGAAKSVSLSPEMSAPAVHGPSRAATAVASVVCAAPSKRAYAAPDLGPRAGLTCTWTIGPLESAARLSLAA